MDFAAKADMVIEQSSKSRVSRAFPEESPGEAVQLGFREMLGGDKVGYSLKIVHLLR
jgi:hypothetical protein